MKSYTILKGNEIIIRSGLGKSKVLFNSGFIFPVIHKKLKVNIGVNKIKICFFYKNSLLSKDQIEFEMSVVLLFSLKEDEGIILDLYDRYREAGDELNRISNENIDILKEEIRGISSKYIYLQLEERSNNYKFEVINMMKKSLEVSYNIEDLSIDYLYKVEE